MIILFCENILKSKLLLIPILLGILSSSPIMIQSAHAEPHLVISDQASCEAISASWSDNTCTITGFLTFGLGSNLTVNRGITLQTGPGSTIYQTGGELNVLGKFIHSGTMTVTGGAINGNVFVNDGTLNLVDGTVNLDNGCIVNGKIKSSGGTIIIIDCVVTKNIVLDGTGLIVTDSTLYGNLKSTNSQNVDVSFSTINGNLRVVSQNSDVQLETLTVGKGVQIFDADIVVIEEANIGKNLKINDSSETQIESSEILGNAVLKNGDTAEIELSTIHKNLRLIENSVVFPHENHVLGNMVLLNNVECSEFDNTVDGKTKIKDCYSPPDVNSPPTIGSVTIDEEFVGPFLNDVILTCFANDVNDLDGDDVLLTYSWSNSNGDVLSTENVLEVPNSAEIYTCEVTPFDGMDFGISVTGVVTISSPGGL